MRKQDEIKVRITNDWEYRILVRQITSGEWVDVYGPQEDRDATEGHAEYLRGLHRDDPSRVRLERRAVGPWKGMPYTAPDKEMARQPSPAPRPVQQEVDSDGRSSG